MIFPSDSEIREFTAYAIRTRKIIVEQFGKLEGRPPNELEIQELLKMVVVPFGILKQQNGNSHFQRTQIATQKQMQQPEQKQKNESSVNSVMDIVKEHSELSIEGERDENLGQAFKISGQPFLHYMMKTLFIIIKEKIIINKHQ